MESFLEYLQEKSWFSALDLSSGYGHIEVDLHDRDKYMLSLRSGLYQLNTLSMDGLVPTKCLNYLDDIPGSSTLELLGNMSSVL